MENVIKKRIIVIIIPPLRSHLSRWRRIRRLIMPCGRYHLTNISYYIQATKPLKPPLLLTTYCITKRFSWVIMQNRPSLSIYPGLQPTHSKNVYVGSVCVAHTHMTYTASLNKDVLHPGRGQLCRLAQPPPRPDPFQGVVGGCFLNDLNPMKVD
jgi:hypothetical protein